MFRTTKDNAPNESSTPERVDTVLGPGIAWQGSISGSGGARIEGAFDGEISILGIVIVGPNGRVSCKHLKAETVIVAGSLKGDITAKKVDILRTGRVWGNVSAVSFSTEEGAFLRGQITMDDEIDLGLDAVEQTDPEPQEDSPPSA
jgi:cytoskeletal protein CcmA (bactofilin family)